MDMKKLISNYQKPTPPVWRKIGDFSLLAIPIIEAQFAFIPAEINPWVKWSITTIFILIKVYSNTKVDHNQYEGRI